MENINELLEETISTVREAGFAIMDLYGKEIDITTKTEKGGSPVTAADFASNKIIIDRLSKYNYGILSEESAEDESRFEKSRVWIIDPLDGTKDFIQQTDEFTVMVALVEKKDEIYRPILGVIYAPAINTLYFASLDNGTYMQHGGNEAKRIKVDSKNAWDKLTLLTSRNHPSELEEKIVQKMHIPEKLSRGSSLKACLVAEGRGHINFNPNDKTYEYDICASDIILSEAGGKMTDTEGNIFKYNKKDTRNIHGYVASNSEIHNQLIQEIKNIKS